MYVLPFSIKAMRRKADDVGQEGPSPDEVLDEIDSITARLDDLESAETGDEAAAIADELEQRLADLPFGSLSVVEDDAWNDVEAALADLVDLIAERAGEGPLDRDAPAGGQKRRRLLDDIIVDAFYHGLYNVGRASWWTLKQVVSVSIEAGRIAAPHVARAASAAASAAGEIAVEAYERTVNGVTQMVDAHARDAPNGDD